MQVVITGASRGIGAHLAELYRQGGHNVVGTGRSAAADVSMDVTRPADHATLAEHLDGKQVDLLICNAGVYLDKGQQLEDGYGADMWAHTFAANVTGVFQTIQTLLPHVERSNDARIAIISSQMASQEHAPGGSYIYRASKAAVLNVGRNLATDLKPRNIAVGIYHPGWVRTDMGGDAADISVEESAKGLAARFAELDMETTGCFRTWDGRDHAF